MFAVLWHTLKDGLCIMKSMSKETKWDIWIEPKDGSANGYWFGLERRDSKSYADKVVRMYFHSVYFTYEVRERNET